MLFHFKFSEADLVARNVLIFSRVLRDSISQFLVHRSVRPSVGPSVGRSVGDAFVKNGKIDDFDRK